jgi:hypothetical protein
MDPFPKLVSGPTTSTHTAPATADASPSACCHASWVLCHGSERLVIMHGQGMHDDSTDPPTQRALPPSFPPSTLELAFRNVRRSMRKRTERSMVKTGMEGCRTAKLVAEMSVRDCTAPKTLPAEKSPCVVRAAIVHV